jgi:hypothetical protein
MTPLLLAFRPFDPLSKNLKVVAITSEHLRKTTLPASLRREFSTAPALMTKTSAIFSSGISSVPTDFFQPEWPENRAKVKNRNQKLH